MYLVFQFSMFLPTVVSLVVNTLLHIFECEQALC